MDTLYYSNYCKHSQRVLQYLVKTNLTNKISFICIDKRKRDVNNNQIYIELENGQKVIMPPHVQSVPALLLVNQNYKVVLGDDIISHYQPLAREEGKKKISNFQGEPVGTSLQGSFGNSNIISESYTYYGLSPDELSAKGNSQRRNMHNYVSANDEIISIYTPPDNYTPDKVESDVTVDTLQQKRMDEIQTQQQQFIPKL
tara:strand:+ start:872 stop:1471 length:600 start_codon:yes stop_codon:yes gene_type:complete